MKAYQNQRNLSFCSMNTPFVEDEIDNIDIEKYLINETCQQSSNAQGQNRQAQTEEKQKKSFQCLQPSSSQSSQLSSSQEQLVPKQDSSQHILKKKFFDELIRQIDQFQALYHISKTQEQHKETLLKQVKTQHPPQRKVIKISKNILCQDSDTKESESPSIALKTKNYQQKSPSNKTSRKKWKKIPQIYAPELSQIKVLYFELKKIHLASILKNPFILENYQPKNISKTAFIEQVSKIVKLKNQDAQKIRRKNQQTEEKMHNIPIKSSRKITIIRKQDESSTQKESENTNDFASYYREQGFELIQVEEINFNQSEKEFVKHNSQLSLSTTIDLIEEEDYQQKQK